MTNKPVLAARVKLKKILGDLKIHSLFFIRASKFKLMKPCMPGRNISILLNLIYFENLFREIGFSSSYCFVPVYLKFKLNVLNFFENLRLDIS